MKKTSFLLLLMLVTVLSVEAQNEQPGSFNNSVKLNFGFSWFYGGPIVTYEHALKPNHSHEYSIGACFPNHDNHNRPNEISISAGHKFMTDNDYGQALRGFYVKPSIYLTYSWLTLPVFDHNEGWNIITNNHTESSLVAAIIPKCGYQLVTRRGFTWDYYIGAGVWFGDIRLDGEGNNYQVSFAAIYGDNPNVGMALIGGMNFGWSF